MFQGLSELTIRSKTGTYLFWARIIVFIFMLITVSYSVYWSVLVSDSAWLSIIGGSLLAINIFNIIFSFIALIVMLFAIIGILSQLEKILTPVFFIALVATIVDSCVALSYSTEEKFYLSYQLVLNQCSNEVNTSSFCSTHLTTWSMRKYVRERTSDPYNVMAALAGSLIVFGIAIAILVLIQNKNTPKSEEQNNPQQDQSPLLNQHQEEQNDTIQDPEIPPEPTPEKAPLNNTYEQNSENSDYYSYDEPSEEKKPTPAVEKPVARARGRAPVPKPEPEPEPEPEPVDYYYYDDEEEDSFHTG